MVQKNHENRPERFPGKREPACDNIEMRNSRPEKERLFLRKKAAGCVRPADRTGKGGFVLPDHQGGFVIGQDPAVLTDCVKCKKPDEAADDDQTTGRASEAERTKGASTALSEAESSMSYSFLYCS